jgi:hypothetical protein
VKTLCILALAVLAGGCFDSLITNPCASGYELDHGACVSRLAAVDAGVDGGDGGPPLPPDDAGDAGIPPDALVCTPPELACGGVCIDVSSDPDNCGACNHVCASGICTLGHCEGELSGHIVAIGHDYRAHHAAMRRVLGNAVGLAVGADLAVGVFRGTAAASSHAGTQLALTQAMTALGRTWHPVTLAAASNEALAGIDVMLVEAQRGDEAAAAAVGATWAAPIEGLLQRGGVVVVLEGADGVSFAFAGATGALVLEPTGAPVEVTGLPALIVAGSDAVAQGVVSPYAAESTSVAWSLADGVVIATPGGPLAVHQTRF